jgi:hypothetical protein
LAVKGTDGRCFIMVAAEIANDAPCEIQVRSFVNPVGTTPGSETVVRSRVVGVDPTVARRRIHMFTFVTGDQFSVDVASVGSAGEVLVRDIDVRIVRNLVRLPPTTYSTNAGIRSYFWHNRPATPSVLFVVTTGGAGTVVAYSGAEKIVGRSAALSHPDLAGLLTQPLDGTMVLDVPTSLQVADVFAVAYTGGYYGDFDGYTG